MASDAGPRLDASLLAFRARALKLLLARKGVSVAEDLIRQDLGVRSNSEVLRQSLKPQTFSIARIYSALQRLRRFS